MQQARKKANPPKIHHMAALWTLSGYGSKKGEWSLDEKLKHIKKAGFDGFAGRVPQVMRDLVERHGLLFGAISDIGEAKEVIPKLKAIKEAGAVCVNVQMLDHDTPTKVAVALARRVMDAADKLNMEVGIEVHRDTCTETPEKVVALAEGYEKAEGRPLKLTWDFSHPAIIKHISPPYWDRLINLLNNRTDLIQYATQFHFRPFNGHHCQISALDRNGKFTPEFLHWLPFAEKVIENWLKAATPSKEMFVCPEQGPPSYALSIFPDLWKDAQAIKNEVDKIWKKHVKQWQPSFTPT